MACTRPLWAYPAPPGAPNRRPVFSAHKSYSGAQAFKIPCGKCQACSLSRGQDWSTRIVHEAKLHADSCFLTATFDEAHLPPDLSISVRHTQDFLRRLRRHYGPLRFFACGEYGKAPKLRPHYHFIIFGLDPPDKVLWDRSKAGFPLYRSPTITELWGMGECLIGALTPQSAGYTARYSTKKVGDVDNSRLLRTRFDPETGALHSWFVRPEFIVMSRRPGIGYGWFDRYRSDFFPSDFVIVDGARRPVPAFYKSKLSLGQQADVTLRRKAAARAPEVVWNNSDSRLAVREEVLRLRAAQLVRGLE